MAIDLYFELAATLRLAEHAVAAARHRPSPSEHLRNLPCPGGLAWVSDVGTYLMSTGLPDLRCDPDNPRSMRIGVYAEGWGPASSRCDLARTDVGGGPSVEHVHLGTRDTPGRPPLIDLLRGAAQDGYHYLVLRVTADQFSPGVSRTGPDHR